MVPLPSSHHCRCLKPLRPSASFTVSQVHNSLTEHISSDLQTAAFCSYRVIASKTLKAEFRHTILVADRSEAGRRSVADLLARASSLLASYDDRLDSTAYRPGRPSRWVSAHILVAFERNSQWKFFSKRYGV